MYHRSGGVLQVLLVHPGGPFWAKKDLGSWSIPKGEYETNEDPLAAARREFAEETGLEPSGPFTPLTPIKLPSGKLVRAWAFEGDCEASAIKSNTFSTQWPPGSGKRQEFPEVDRAEWFPIDEAKRKILPGQLGLIEELACLPPPRPTA